MINSFKIEFLKTKRNPIRKVTMLFPIIVIIVIGMLFFSTGEVIPSIINQWGVIWASFYLALIIGMIDRNEKKYTQYKTILSSPYDLKKYELGRISNDILLYFFGTIVLMIILCLLTLLIKTNMSVFAICESVISVFLATLWEVPLYSLISRLTNLYITVVFTFAGVFLEILTNNLKYGVVWPFTWPAIVTVRFTKLNINGTMATNITTKAMPVILLIICLSLILFTFISYLSAISFRNQVKK